MNNEEAKEIIEKVIELAKVHKEMAKQSSTSYGDYEYNLGKQFAFSDIIKWLTSESSRNLYYERYITKILYKDAVDYVKEHFPKKRNAKKLAIAFLTEERFRNRTYTRDFIEAVVKGKKDYVYDWLNRGRALWYQPAKSPFLPKSTPPPPPTTGSNIVSPKNDANGG